MDFFFGHGVKCFYLFIPKTSIRVLKLPFLRKCTKVISNYQIQYPEKCKKISHLSSNSYQQWSNQQIKVFKTNISLYKNSSLRYSSTSKSDSKKTTLPHKDCYDPPPVANHSMFQKMKQMTRDYWHILIPVHIVTSIGWATAFYTAAKNGVDIIGILQSLNLSERYLEMLRDSNAGHWAITYALYKIFTPLRYTVTVGSTTMCIKYLNKWGYLRHKKNPKLSQSMKCAEEHRSSYGNSNESNATNQSQSPKI